MKIEVEPDDKQNNEDEKGKEIEEDPNTVKKLEEKPVEAAAETADSVEHVAVPIEGNTEEEKKEVKFENVEGGDGEVRTDHAKEEEAEPRQEQTMPLISETVVTNETETSEDYSKYQLDDELPWAIYRSMDTPPQKNPIEEDDDWPASEDDEDYGNMLFHLSVVSKLMEKFASETILSYHF